jgi:aubergine-like protein
LSNPEGVAIVDDVVLADRINFFLVAQKVNQGTATPTHYQVVYNQSELGLE